MILRATDFEFRQRAWIFMALLGGAFVSYGLDSTSAATALAAAIGRDASGARHALQAIAGLAALLVTFAALLRTWGHAYLNSNVVRDTALHTERLVADGPYRHTRNPLYLAILLLGLGLSLAASRLGAVLLVSGIWLFVYRLIGREEAELREALGAQHEAFCAALPKVWPSIVPRLPPGGAHPQWGQALSGEAWIWGFAAMTAGFAWTLDQRLFVWGTPLSLLAYVLNRVVVRRRRAVDPRVASPEGSSSR
jgi:protein-S-isoprenylcysteine O-methyltransferase Ste14